MRRLDKQIRCCLKIADVKTISRAAEELELTQSSVSRQLAALEMYIGKPLFYRTGRGVELTDTGVELMAVSRKAYKAIDETVEALREFNGVMRGTVRIATVHSLSYYFLAEVMAEFAGRQEQVSQTLMTRSSPEVVELVESGKADIGFVYDTAVASLDLVSVPLFNDEMCLIVAAGSPIAPILKQSNIELRLVGFPAHYALRRMLNSSGLRLCYVAEAETIDAMLKLVSSGIGACILPSRIPDRLLMEYGLEKRVIDHPGLSRRIVAIVQGGRSPSMAVQALVDIAQSLAQQENTAESAVRHIKSVA